MGTILEMIQKNFLKNATMELDAHSVTVYTSSTMYGNRSSVSLISRMDGSNLECCLKLRVYLLPSCYWKNFRGKKRRKIKYSLFNSTNSFCKNSLEALKASNLSSLKVY
jgi:hypothetical protein